MRPSAWVFLVALALLPPRVTAQEPSTLVVVIAGESRYHEAGCPLVAKAGSGVTMVKLSDATTKGLTAHDCQQAAIEQPKKDANAVQVLVQPGDRRYHQTGCPKLKGAASKTALGEAGKRHFPCPVCKPPIRQREKPVE